MNDELSSKVADAAFPYFASVMLPDCDYPELEVCSKWMIWVSQNGGRGLGYAGLIADFSDIPVR